MTATVANANLIESALAYYSPQKQSQRLYEKQREEDILQNAIDHGYLKSPSASDIISVSEDLQEEDIDILDKVLIVAFGLARLQKIDELRTCINLTICNLCCNFIKDIEPLKCCTSLVKLDLHGNQIIQLPDASFWVSLQQLMMLYLDDNQISDFDSLNKLKMSQGIVILTLYDTPLSLKRHYRHFTVNAIWSLKSLDNVVISDEEIIEDAHFGPLFSSLQPQFHYRPISMDNGKMSSMRQTMLTQSRAPGCVISWSSFSRLFHNCLSQDLEHIYMFEHNLYIGDVKNQAYNFLCAKDNTLAMSEAQFIPRSIPILWETNDCYIVGSTEAASKRKSYKDEWSAVHNDIATVNKIQAKYCPVLVIQRYVRGHLARLRYRYIQDTRIWAAVTIQRFYRSYKGIPPPEPSTGTTVSNIYYTSLSSVRLDYESYIKSRRSKDRSMMALVSPRIDPSSEFAQLKRSSDEVDYTYSREKRKKKLRVDLNKLNASTSEIIENAEILLLADGFANLKTGLKSSSLRQRFSFENKLESSPVNINRLKKETGMTLVPVEREAEIKDKTKLGKYYTQYKFLGALNSEQQDEHLTNRTRMKEDEDVYKIPFRLSVTAPPILRRDLLEELFIETVQGASDIRNSIREAERYLANLPPKVVKKKPGTTIDQRMFIRTHGTMSLGTFRAVEQAYKDRDRAEALASKMSKVRHLKKKREHSIERTKSYKMKYSQIISRRKTDGKEIVSDAIAENKRQDKSLYENLQATRMATKQYKHKINTDRRFALDFIAQNNAVSKALAVHARTIQNENRIKEKAENVESWRAREGQQRETIQRFQKHQQLMRQAEAALTRANLEGVVLNDRNARQSKIRDRVEELKERKVTTHIGDKLASVTLAPPSLPPLAVIAPDQIETWENLPRKELKPRVHDRNVPWL